MYDFVPSWHFVEPSKKLTPEWCWDAVNWAWYHSNNRSLLHDKDLQEIDGYASGDFSMLEFKKMYKSEAKKLNFNKNDRIDDRANSRHVGIGFIPLPLIPTKLNSAIAIVQKIPIDISVECQDPLAIEKKNEDLTFLKNKPAIQAQLQEISDKMQAGKVDLGTTKHSAVPYSDSPYGLDLNDPEDETVFVNLIYNLGVEAAFETVLEIFQEMKKGTQVKLLQIIDQFKYGVSVQCAFKSAMTKLPDVKYVHPATVTTPQSLLPDFSDNPHRFIEDRVTVMDLFNLFGNEICNEETLAQIINGEKTGYCACNDIQVQNTANFNQFKVDLIYCEVKSIDYVGVAPINKKSKFNYLVSDTSEDIATCTDKIWGQNTYGFWWLKNTKHFYGIHRLDYSYRVEGQESYQNFSYSIYKSQKKSAVEMSIGENKKAQIADIKMQHEVIHSLPHGKYINLKFLRSALGSLTKEKGNTWTQNDLIDLAMEKNWFIGDTEGFDGKNDGQLKPFEDIAGGIKSELVGYMNVIADASNKISQFTGINEQLTGQSANPEGLIGMQKLLINSSINALYYVNEAVEHQEKSKFAIWGNIIKQAIEEGGKPKEAIINLIGNRKVALIDSIKDVPLHVIGVKVTVSQREQEKQDFRDELKRLKDLGVINTVDEYMLSGINNPKDKMALLAVKYKNFEKKQDQIRKEQAMQQQALVQQQGVNQQQAVAAKTDGDIKKVYAQGDVSSKILQLASQLGIQASQLQAVIDKTLQQNRNDGQLDKSIKTIETKQTLENQQPYQ